MSKAVKTVGSVFFIILFSKLLGQVREMMLAAYYGTSYEATAYLTASQIPLNFFDMILGLAIVSAFVPIFNEIYQNEGKLSADNFAGNFIGVVTVISVVISFLGLFFSTYIVNLIAGGLDAMTSSLASSLLKIMFPSIIFTSLAYSYAGVLQSYGEFKIPAAMSLISNLISIIYFLLFNKYLGIYGLTISMLIGWGLQLLILIPSLIKLKFKFKISFNFASAGMKKIYKLSGPILLSSWVQPINMLVNLYLASFLNQGQAVSAINYANKLYLIIASVFTVSVTNIILPELSRNFSAQNKDKASEIISSSVKAVILFLLPVMALFIIFRVPIIQIIYQRGAFNTESTKLTAYALGFYSLGMIGYGISEIMNKAFYAMQKPKYSAIVAFTAVALNIVLSFLFYKPMGIGGLALASALSATYSAITLILIMNFKIKCINVKTIVNTLVKGLLSVLLASLVTIIIVKFFNLTQTSTVILLVKTALLCLLTVFVYLISLLVLKTKEITFIINDFKRR